MSCQAFLSSGKTCFRVASEKQQLADGNVKVYCRFHAKKTSLFLRQEIHILEQEGSSNILKIQRLKKAERNASLFEEQAQLEQENRNREVEQWVITSQELVKESQERALQAKEWSDEHYRDVRRRAEEIAEMARCEAERAQEMARERAEERARERAEERARERAQEMARERAEELEEENDNHVIIEIIRQKRVVIQPPILVFPKRIEIANECTICLETESRLVLGCHAFQKLRHVHYVGTKYNWSW
jgi:hypothetical protein